MNYFINILFGHLVGDFLLQPKSMAVKKGASNWIAAMHVSIYTITLCLFTSWNIKWVVYVWATHFVIDRCSLADKWLQLIKGRDMPDFFYNGAKGISVSISNPDYKGGKIQKLTNEDEQLNYRILRGAFTAIVYTVVDATLHLGTMYYAYPYLVK